LILLATIYGVILWHHRLFFKERLWKI
jgi:hypothetical protein